MSKLTDYYTAKEVAQILNLTANRVLRLNITGKIKIGRQYFYPKGSVKAFAKLNRPQGRPQGFSPVK